MNQIIIDYNKTKDDSLFLSQLEKFTFPLKIVGFKEDRDNLPIISELQQIPSIENKNILYNEKFIQYFYNIFSDLIYKLGKATNNFYKFIEEIVFEMNRITTKDYVLYDCHSTDYYECGRAIIVLDKYPTQFLVFNSDEGYIDNYTQYLYLGCPSEKLIKISLETPESSEIYKKYENIKRIKQEIKKLEKDFNVQVFQEDNKIKLYLRKDKILITFNIPYDYPFNPPSGTFNDLRISGNDIGWKGPERELKNIVDELMIKHKTNKFPIHREILCYLTPI